MHLGLRLIRYCDAKTFSPRSSTCICDRESRSPEPSSSTILHREMVNKVFRKRSSRLLTRFFKYFTTTRLPLHQTRTEGRLLQCELRQADHRLNLIIVVKESQVTHSFFSQTISYILNMLIYVGMILLDNLLFITVIDLCRTCNSTAILICNVLVMFIIYP
jgi:hypothetical protein